MTCYYYELIMMNMQFLVARGPIQPSHSMRARTRYIHKERVAVTRTASCMTERGPGGGQM